jgi:hypothetical protein
MASHFKWYPSETEVVVPFNARYAFPTQANKSVKMTPRIPPKSGMEYSAGSVIRLEFPAQGNLFKTMKHILTGVLIYFVFLIFLFTEHF